MAGVLGRAFVQVFADLSTFTPGLKEKIKKSLDEQTKGLKFEELDKSAEKAGESAADELAKGVDSKIENNMEKEGKKGGSSFGRGLSSAIGAITSLFLPVLIALGVEAVAALAPAALALGAVIPAAIGTLIGSMAALKLATDGVGAAIKASFDPKNAAAFQKAMEKLSPAARSFVTEIKNLHPAFHQLQQDVQQVFFTQLKGVLTQVATKLLPTLRTGLGLLSQDVGRLGAALLNGFGNRSQAIASIFLAAHAALVPLVPAIGQFVSALLTIAAVAGPLFASLSTGFAGLLKRFVDFINEAASSGSLAKFFNDALVVLKQLGGLLGNVFDLINAVIGALQADGAQAIGFLSTVIGQLAAFFATAQGKQTLANVFLLLNTALSSLSQILTPLLPVIVELAGVFAGQLAIGLEKVTPYLVTMAGYLAQHPDLIAAAVTAWATYTAALKLVAAAEAIVDGLSPVGWIVLAAAAIAAGAYLIYKNWDAVVSAVKTGAAAVGAFFTGIWNWIVSVGKSIGDWFTITLPAFFASLPGKIWAALSSIPAMLGRLFLDALHNAGMEIGIGIGLILAILIKAPGLIWDAVKAVGHLFVDLWHLAINTGDAVLHAGVNAIIFTFTQLPGRIASFMNRLPGIIGGALRSAFDAARNYVREGANDIVSFVGALPRRVSGFMRNVGSDILGGLRSGIDSVISGFNSGIDRVSSAIHIGLPHLPMLAAGGLINAPTLAVVGEAGPEAVIPMSDPNRAAAVAQKTGLLDMLGSKASQVVPNVRVYLGTREITDILDVRIDNKLNDQANELSYGTR